MFCMQTRKMDGIQNIYQKNILDSNQQNKFLNFTKMTILRTTVDEQYFDMTVLINICKVKLSVKVRSVSKVTRPTHDCAQHYKFTRSLNVVLLHIKYNVKCVKSILIKIIHNRIANLLVHPKVTAPNLIKYHTLIPRYLLYYKKSTKVCYKLCHSDLLMFLFGHINF